MSPLKYYLLKKPLKMVLMVSMMSLVLNLILDIDPWLAYGTPFGMVLGALSMVFFIPKRSPLEISFVAAMMARDSLMKEHIPDMTAYHKQVHDETLRIINEEFGIRIVE
jgi:hypothetical protein